jgi:hypothetical protein
MVDEGAHNWRQATARHEDQVDNAVLRAPLREDMHQATARQFASAGVIRQEGHTKPVTAASRSAWKSTQVIRGS